MTTRYQCWECNLIEWSEKDNPKCQVCDKEMRPVSKDRCNACGRELIDEDEDMVGLCEACQ